VIGDLKQMSTRWFRGVSFLGYGVSLMLGVGIPIPILDENMLKYVAVTDEELFAPIVDYSKDYPQGTGEILGRVSYAQLKSGKITLGDKTIPTAPLSSYAGAREIAEILKEWILKGEFLLTKPAFTLPLTNEGIDYKGSVGGELF
jgi:uncharacterized protein (DUF39 family)